MRSGNFTLRHVDFLVSYEYDPPKQATETDPPFAATAEILHVYMSGSQTDLLPFFSDITIEELHDLIVEYELAGGAPDEAD